MASEKPSRCMRHGCDEPLVDRFDSIVTAGMASRTLTYGTGERHLCARCYWLLQDWLTGTNNSLGALVETPRSPRSAP